MWKQALGFGLGIVVGTAAVIVAYKCYQKYKADNNIDTNDEYFSEKLKEAEENTQKFKDLMSNQSYVDCLSASELSMWFKENKEDFSDDVKMIIAVPTEKILRGIGVNPEETIDTDYNIIQMFYDDKNGVALKTRLINFSEIDSNLQEHLLESNGMLVLTN